MVIIDDPRCVHRRLGGVRTPYRLPPEPGNRFRFRFRFVRACVRAKLRGRDKSPQRWAYQSWRNPSPFAGSFGFTFAAICMGFKHFYMIFFGSRLDFAAICMGFKTLVSGCISFCMGFKRSHLLVLAIPFPVLGNPLLVLANPLLVLANPLLVHC